MKTDSILTAMSEFTGGSEIPVSLIRHSARRAASRNRVDLQAAAVRVMPLGFAPQAPA
jgi:hypothetical protein